MRIRVPLPGPFSTYVDPGKPVHGAMRAVREVAEHDRDLARRPRTAVPTYSYVIIAIMVGLLVLLIGVAALMS